jgi:hypothetical protein
MQKIELKVNKEDFEKILSGDKTFEVRLGDRNFQTDDVLVLLEKDPDTKELTGRKVEKTITFTKNTKDANHWPKEDIEKFGLQIIAFK